MSEFDPMHLVPQEPIIRAGERWTKEQAQKWYAQQPWQIGANYNPSDACNAYEMWQEETFNPELINKELGWAAGLGMNTMRIFLQYQVWEQDPVAFKERMRIVEKIAESNGIKPMWVPCDSVWNPYSALGKQPEPRKGTHNSCWTQSPGADVLTDATKYGGLYSYIDDIARTFGRNDRIIDLWNEPNNMNHGTFSHVEPVGKIAIVANLLENVFDVAQKASPDTPFTSGLWCWDLERELDPVEKVQLARSDIRTFHSYDAPERFKEIALTYMKDGYPVICTEWMARHHNNKVDNILPIALEYNIGMVNWGFVAGKTGTIYPWNTFCEKEPEVWFHDVLKRNGEPYDATELAYLRSAVDIAKLPVQQRVERLSVFKPAA